MGALAPLAAALLLCAAAPAQARIRNDGADDLFVEYEEYELPENETGNAYGSPEERAWESQPMMDFYGFDIEPCLASGCTEDMLSNDVCDEMCNHALCEYDITLCFKFFDMHGYGWDFDGCYATGCTKEMLFDGQCDAACESEVCHNSLRKLTPFHGEAVRSIGQPRFSANSRHFLANVSDGLSTLGQWDNWRCFVTDEYELYDKAGHGWDDDLELCYEEGCDESLLFNGVCDDLCNSEACHWDNFMCMDSGGVDGAGGGGAFRDEL